MAVGGVAGRTGGRLDRGAAIPVVVAVVAGTVMATFVGQAGPKLVLAAAGVLVLAVAVLVARDRALLVLFLLAASMQATLHKTLGPIDATVQSGAIAVYITSVDVLLLVLYGIWFFEGTLVGDLRRELRRGLLLLPLVMIPAALPSFLNAPYPGSSLAEVVREGWMWLLFIYVAIRVRTRVDAAWLLGALFLVALGQCLLVLYQQHSGGLAGLSLLGEDTSVVALRSTDSVTIFRPSGTAIHPDILAATMGPIGLVFLSLALNLREPRLRLGCLGASAVAVVPMVLSQTRATAIGFALAGGCLLALAMMRRQVPWQALVLAALATAIGVWRFWDRIWSLVADNLMTDHFQLEVQARTELNGLALDMMQAHPIAGVGLNNFMRVIDDYDRYGVIYQGYPVHNLFLLVFAETGVIGFGAFVAVIVALTVVAVRLARVADPMLGAIGLGVVASFIFFLVEEQLSFSLREDVPLALFWVLTGLTVAGLRLAGPPALKPRAVTT